MLMTSRNTYGFLLLEPTERGKIISKLQETNTLHTLFDLTILGYAWILAFFFGQVATLAVGND